MAVTNCSLPTKKEEDIAKMINITRKVVGKSHNFDKKYIMAVIDVLTKGYSDEDRLAFRNQPLPKLVTIVRDYIDKLEIDRAKATLEAINNPIVSYSKLRRVYDAVHRADRINMLSAMFSEILDKIQNEYPNVSREDLCNGITINGKKIGGEDRIFYEIARIIEERALHYKSVSENPNAYEGGESWSQEKIAEFDRISKEYFKVLDNWGAFVSMTRMALKETEGLKIGQKSKYVAEAALENFSEEELESYVVEEAIKEGWMTMTDQVSAYGTLGSQVRRVLGKLYQRDEQGSFIYDDLGQPKRVNPVQAHREVADVCRGMISSSDMLSLLRAAHESYKTVSSAGKEHSMFKDILKILEENSNLITPFYVDFKKNFVPYSKLSFRNWNFNIINLNGIFKNVYKDKYELSVRLGNIDDSTFEYFLPGSSRLLVGRRIYKIGSDGKVYADLAGIKELHNYIAKYFGKVNSNNKIEWAGSDNLAATTFGSGNVNMRARMIFTVYNALGIKTSWDDAKTLASAIRGKKKQIDRFIETVIRLSDNFLKDQKVEVDYLTKLKTTIGKQELDVSLLDTIGKLEEVLNKFSKSKKLEAAAPYKNSKGKRIILQSIVAPNFIGDFFGKIQRFSELGAINTMRDWLRDLYFDSPIFGTEEHSYNAWLSELFNDKTGEEFASEFTMERHVGTDETPFENYNKAQHITALIQYFNRDRAANASSNYAYYPVFIEGDAGQCKFIKAKRYSVDDAVKKLVDIYHSEIERMKVAYATGDSMKKEGFNGVKVFDANKTQFRLLPFLNDKFKVEFKEVDVDGVKELSCEVSFKETDTSISIQDIETAIREAIVEEKKTFMKTLADNGLLKKTINNNYRFLSTYNTVVNEENIDAYLSEYLVNSKLALCCQLQLMTTCPSFYKDSETLQKRYKEIHAPGTELDLNAIDPYNRKEDGSLGRYSEDGTETVIYFTDEVANPQEDNPQLLELIRKQFGENSDIYKNYRDKTSVTDGQGYRTLSGYRKVMGMAGKWTEEMQNAYNAIQEIRDAIKNRENKNATMEEIKQLSELAVVFQPIKPYWYGFEKYQYDNEHFINIPVQHKYAEAIIIPELLPKGTLKDMATYAEENNIDLICSTECVKVGSWGDVKIDPNDVVGSLSKAKVHKLSYSGYKIQTNLPEHFNVNNQLFGTQVRKLIMDKITKMADYSRYFEGIAGFKGTINVDGENLKPTGINVINLFNNIICANILDSEAKFNEIMKDPKKLSDMLVQLIASNSRNSKESLLSFELIDGVFSSALSEAGVAHDVIASILSEFRKTVNKQRIKGGSAVQVSSFGITHIEGATDRKLEYKVVNGNVVYAECEIPFNLSYKDATGREIKLKFEDYCDEEGNILTDKDGNTLIEKDFPGILDILAYRIPTEKHYSMANLRVVRFCKPIEGGIMRLPAEITQISGADFDADKLYFILKEFVQSYDPDKLSLDKKTKDAIWDKVWEMYPNIKEALLLARNMAGYEEGDRNIPTLNSFWEQSTIAFTYDKNEIFSEAAEELEIELKYTPEWVTYDLNKPASEQSISARNNMLLEIMRQRLMDPETLKDRMTPGGFANPKEGARKMRHLVLGSEIAKSCLHGDTLDFSELERKENTKNDPKKSYDPTDINTLIYYNEQNQIAAKLIGAMANHNSNSAYSSVCADLRLKEEIKFGSHLEGVVTSEVYDKRAGTVTKESGATSLLSSKVTVTYKDGTTMIVDPSLSVAELLASSVDAVKEPVLNYLNLNTATANIGALLARLGYSFDDIGLLLNQPCVKEMCELCFNSNTNSLSYAISKIKNKYKTAKGAVHVSPNDVLTRDKLAYYIYNKSLNDAARINNPEVTDVTTQQAFAAGQFHVMELIEKISLAAGELDSFVKATKFTASNSVGSTVGELYAQQMKVDDYLANAQSDTSALQIVVDEFLPMPIRNDLEYDIDLSKSEERVKYLKEISRSPFAFEQAMYDANKRLLKELMKYFPYETPLYRSVREVFKELSFYTMDGATIDSIHNDLMIYLMTRQSGDFDGERRSYFLNEFPKELFHKFNEDKTLSENLLLQSLGLIKDEPLDSVVIDTNNIHKLQSGEKDILKESWEDLYKTHPEIAKDLFLYCFYRAGFEFNATTFIHLCPMAVKKAIEVSPGKSYYEFLDEINKGVNLDNNSIAEFAVQYLSNHRDNYRFNYVVRQSSDPSKLDSLLLSKSSELGRFKNSFEIVIDSQGEVGNDFKKIASISKESAKFKPVIVFGDPNSTTCVVYVANPTSLNTTSNEFKMTYVKVSTRGLNANGIQRSLDYGTLYNEVNEATPQDLQKHEDGKEGAFPEGGTEVMDSLYEATLRNEITIDEGIEYMKTIFGSEIIESNVGLGGKEVTLKRFADSKEAIKKHIEAIINKRKGEHCTTNTGETSCHKN